MKKHFISFLVGLMIFGVGCGYIAFEVVNFDIVSVEESNYLDLKTYERTYEVDGTYYKFHNLDGSINLVIDDNESNIKVSYKYDSKIVTPKQTEQNKNIYYSFNYSNQTETTRRVLNIIKRSVKDKEIYNYDEIFHPIITITVNSENQKYISTASSYQNIDFDF